MKSMSWYVYILKCADGTLYAGATNDVVKRFAAHSEGKGAKYTRGRRPLQLVWKRRFKNRGAALSFEAAIKRLARADKLALIDGRFKMGL